MNYLFIALALMFFFKIAMLPSVIFVLFSIKQNRTVFLFECQLYLCDFWISRIGKFTFSMDLTVILISIC